MYERLHIMKKKHSFLKVILTVLLMIALLVSAVGCGGGDTQSTGKTKLPMQTEGNETNQPETTEPSQPEQTDALTALRARMQEELIAVADFGFPELSELKRH